MAPSRRKGSVKVSVSTAAAANRQWKVGDLVLAKVKGFPAWPATVSAPEEWGYSKDWKKVLVYFFGTKQIAFCSPADVEPFTEEKKQTLLLKRQGKGADFIRAVHEIIDSYEQSKAQELIDKVKPEQEPPTNCLNWEDGDHKCFINDHVYSSSETDTSQIRVSLSMKNADDPDLSAEDSPEKKKLLLLEDRRESRHESLPPNFLVLKRSKTATAKGRGTLKRLLDVHKPIPSPEAEIHYSNSGLQSSDVFYSAASGFSIRRVKDNDSEIDAVESMTPTVREYSDMVYSHENGHRDSMMDGLKEGVLFCNHDLMKEVATKKRRKLNKKPVSDDETEVNLGGSGVIDCQNMEELRRIEDVQPAAIQKDCSDDWYDLLLPPFKRALVRVQSASLVGELNGDPLRAADLSIKSASSQFGRGSSSSGGNSVSTDRESCSKNRANSTSPVCQRHALNHKDTPSHSGQGERCPCPDNEAVLPPSKRLRRALKAMSMNTSDGSFEIDNDGSLSGKSSVTECSFVLSELERRADVSGMGGASLRSKDSVPSSTGLGVEDRSGGSQLFDDNLTESASSIGVVDACLTPTGIYVSRAETLHSMSEHDGEELLLLTHEKSGLPCLEETTINLSPPAVGITKLAHEGSVSSVAAENSRWVSNPGSDWRCGSVKKLDAFFDPDICNDNNTEPGRLRLNAQAFECQSTSGGSLSPPCHPGTLHSGSLGDSGSGATTADRDTLFLSSFKAELRTLTRTRDSIGRATRMAMDGGNPREVVEAIVWCMEKQAKMHRRVDLFFLVDSIIQSSSRLKGGAGNAYGCLIQEALPRLLSAAVPEGHAGHENRRQCLKVLRLWHERKVLPWCVLRRHLIELGGGTACGSRERAHNDPLWGMEDMLVDEYGSNSRIELPGLSMGATTEEESDSDDSTFEAVTPECEPEGSHAHSHILEDVEGELEMEDAVPPETVEDTTMTPPVPPSSSPPPPPPPPPSYSSVLDHSRRCVGKLVECDGFSRQSSSPRMFRREHGSGKAYLTRLPPPPGHHHAGRQPQHVQYVQGYHRNEANFSRPRFYNNAESGDLYGRTMRPTSAYDARERWRFASSSTSSASSLPFVVHVGQVPMAEAYKRGGRGRYQQAGVWNGMPSSSSSSRRLGRRNLVTFACPGAIIPPAVRAPISWRAR